MELNKIYQENCLQTMAKMPDCFVDCVVTSPPYDNLRSYDTGIGNQWNFETFKPIAKELFRVTKEGGVVVWVVNDKTEKGSETGTSFRQVLYFMECGFNLHDTMIYQRFGKFPESNRYRNDFEYMFVLSKGKPKTLNKILDRKNGSYGSKTGGTIRRGGDDLVPNKSFRYYKEYGDRGNVWSVQNGANCTTKDKIAFKHPAIFPEKLAQDHIISWTNENELIYDPFGGSGTTAKMAHLNNRKWILSEISGNYCEIARNRLRPYLNQGSIFSIV